MRKQVPSVNLNCEELISQSRRHGGSSFIEVSEKKLARGVKENSLSKIKKAQNFERLTNHMNNDIGEINLLKTSISTRKTGSQQTKQNNKLKSSERNDQEKKSLLQMKTFNDLQLDLNLFSNSENNSESAESIDFLKNIMGSEHDNHLKREEKITTIPIRSNKTQNEDVETQKMFELLNKLKGKNEQ